MKEFIESLKNKDNSDLIDLLYEYAGKGELAKVKILFSQPQIQNDIESVGTHGVLISACFSGNLELVKYLLTSPEVKNHFDINYDYDSALSSACQAGHLNLVKYLLESPELEKHSEIPFVNGSINNPLVLAAEHKHLEIFEYLILFSKGKDDRLLRHISKASNKVGSSNDFNFIKSFIEIGKKQNEEILNHMVEGIIYGSCYSNNINTVKYIFSSPNLAKYIDIHNDGDELFRTLLTQARMGKSLDVLQYFIFDLNISETDNIKKMRLEYKHEVVENMFKLREINQTLNQDLSINESNTKKIKI